jgi:glycosyltransferase involved in cell wall biosynthesis
MTKIFIGTPCYGGMITADYFKSCLQLTALAATKKIEIQFGTIGNESLVTRARNTLVQLFMDEQKYTHLLFIDADIAFNPETIFRMLELDEEVVTGIYPRKTIDWRKVKKRVIDNNDITIPELHAASLEYNLNVKNPEKISVKNGFIEVLDGATGFMLIKKQVFEKMAKAYPDLKFKSDQHLNDPHDTTFNYHDTSNWNYAFFDTMIDPETKRYLSEDYAFCRLWQKIGGRVYADITSGITHYGNYAFKGNVATQFLPQTKK